MDASTEHVTLIRPRHGWGSLDLAEIWKFRELTVMLALREIKVRYKQTLLGATWAILQPLAAMVVFTLFFGKLAGLEHHVGEAPYPLFSFAGVVLWTYFSHAVSSGSNSVVEYRTVITKVYFPRAILPLTPVLSGLVDFAFSMVVFFILSWVYSVPLTWNLLWIPAFVLLAMGTAVSVSLWFAALNAHFRDFRYVVPFLLQLWLFATPIVYSSSLVPPEWRAWYGLNPMAGAIEGFRWSILGTGAPPGPLIGVSAAAVTLLLVGGFMVFRRLERTFVDVV